MRSRGLETSLRLSGVVMTIGTALALSTACAPALSPDAPAIAHVWSSRCGTCHVRVEPGTRTRAHLEDAFKRHQNRVKLSPEEWAQLVDFLAPPDNAPAESAPPNSAPAQSAPPTK